MATSEENRKEEEAVIERERRAFEKRQAAFLKVHRQFLPYDNGAPTLGSMDEFDKAEAEYKAAQADVDRIVEEIRTGKRP